MAATQNAWLSEGSEFNVQRYPPEGSDAWADLEDVFVEDTFDVELPAPAASGSAAGGEATTGRRAASARAEVGRLRAALWRCEREVEELETPAVVAVAPRVLSPDSELRADLNAAVEATLLRYAEGDAVLAQSRQREARRLAGLTASCGLSAAAVEAAADHLRHTAPREESLELIRELEGLLVDSSESGRVQLAQKESAAERLEAQLLEETNELRKLQESEAELLRTLEKMRASTPGLPQKAGDVLLPGEVPEAPAISTASFHIEGIDLDKLEESDRLELERRIVSELAALLCVPDADVRDLQGRPGRVALSAGSIVVDTLVAAEAPSVEALLAGDAPGQRIVEVVKTIPGVMAAAHGQIRVSSTVSAASESQVIVFGTQACMQLALHVERCSRLQMQLKTQESHASESLVKLRQEGELKRKEAEHQHAARLKLLEGRLLYEGEAKFLSSAVQVGVIKHLEDQLLEEMESQEAYKRDCDQYAVRLEQAQSCADAESEAATSLRKTLDTRAEEEVNVLEQRLVAMRKIEERLSGQPASTARQPDLRLPSKEPQSKAKIGSALQQVALLCEVEGRVLEHADGLSKKVRSLEALGANAHALKESEEKIRALEERLEAEADRSEELQDLCRQESTVSKRLVKEVTRRNSTRDMSAMDIQQPDSAELRRRIDEAEKKALQASEDSRRHEAKANDLEKQLQAASAELHDNRRELEENSEALTREISFEQAMVRCPDIRKHILDTQVVSNASTEAQAKEITKLKNDVKEVEGLKRQVQAAAAEKADLENQLHAEKKKKAGCCARRK